MDVWKDGSAAAGRKILAPVRQHYRDLNDKVYEYFASARAKELRIFQ